MMVSSSVADAIAFFTRDGYRFDPYMRAYWSMQDGWKHDVGSESYPAADHLRFVAESFTAEEWGAFIDALTARFREGVIAGMDDSPWVPFARDMLREAPAGQRT